MSPQSKVRSLPKRLKGSVSRCLLIHRQRTLPGCAFCLLKNRAHRIIGISGADWRSRSEAFGFRAARSWHLLNPVENNDAVGNASLLVPFHKPVEVTALHLPLLHLPVGPLSLTGEQGADTQQIGTADPGCRCLMSCQPRSCQDIRTRLPDMQAHIRLSVGPFPARDPGMNSL